MNRICHSMTGLMLAVVGLAGCAHEWNSERAPHPVTAADLQAVMRNQWSRHHFWIRMSSWTTPRMTFDR